MTANFLPEFHPVVTHGAGATVQCLVRDKAVRSTSASTSRPSSMRSRPGRAGSGPPTASVDDRAGVARYWRPVADRQFLKRGGGYDPRFVLAVLCTELGIRPVTLYRYVDSQGALREQGRKVLLGR